MTHIYYPVESDAREIGTGKRIEELEAKLAKALEALALAYAALSGGNMDMNVVERKVKATIVTLKVQNDE